MYLSFESLDVVHICTGGICTHYRSSSFIKVIRSRSRSQDLKRSYSRNVKLRSAITPVPSRRADPREVRWIWTNQYPSQRQRCSDKNNLMAFLRDKVNVTCVSEILLHTSHLLVYIANRLGDSLTAKLYAVSFHQQ